MASGAEQDGNGRERLKSWKEIAAFFGVDERTAKRWEGTRGLPVHRLPGATRAAIFAYRDELDLWLRSRSNGTTSAEPEAVEQPEAAPLPQKPSHRFKVIAAIGGIALLAGAAAAMLIPRTPVVGPKTPSNPAAETAYLSGLYQLGTRSAEGIDQARRDLLRATRLDPGFAPAVAGLAEAYDMSAQYGRLPDAQAYAAAEATARRAIALDPNYARGYSALGFARFYGGRDFADAEVQFARALQLAPQDAQLHQWHALILMHGGDQRVALAEIERAARLDPASKAIVANHGLILFHAGRTDDAIAMLTALAAAEPRLVSPHAHLATIMLASGRDAEFLDQYELQAGLARSDDLRAIAAAARKAFVAGGRPAMLRSLRDSRHAQFTAGRGSAFQVALAEAQTGDREAALRWLDLAFRRGEPQTVAILLEPALKPLHGDPRFSALVTRAGLPPTA